MDEMNEYKMDADKTSVDSRKELGSFSDLLNGGHSVTVIQVKKIEKPEDIELGIEPGVESGDDDVQDNTRVSLSDMVKKLLTK